MMEEPEVKREYYIIQERLPKTLDKTKIKQFINFKNKTYFRVEKKNINPRIDYITKFYYNPTTNVELVLCK